MNQETQSQSQPEATTEAAGTQPAAEVTSQPETSKADEAYAVFPTKELFEERAARAARSMLKEQLGVADFAQVKQQMSDFAALKAQQEEEKLAAMSEMDRMRLERDEFSSKAAQMQEEVERAVFDSHITKLCAQRGIRDVDYAKYKVMHKYNNLPEDEEIDEAAYIDGLLESKRERVALGVDSLDDIAAAQPAPKQHVRQARATTTPVQNTRATPQADPSGQPAKTAFDMSDAEFRQRLASLGVQE